MDQGEHDLFVFKELISYLFKQTKAEEKEVNFWGKGGEIEEEGKRKEKQEMLFIKQYMKSIWNLRPVVLEGFSLPASSLWLR